MILEVNCLCSQSFCGSNNGSVKESLVVMAVSGIFNKVTFVSKVCIAKICW